MKRFIAYCFLAAFALACSTVFADDGSKLWLSYKPTQNGFSATSVCASASDDVAVDELMKYYKESEDKTLARVKKPTSGTIVLASSNSPEVRALQLQAGVKAQGKDGFVIAKSGSNMVIASDGRMGRLYGVFQFIKMLQTHSMPNKTVEESPAYQVRVLNHWDNLDGTVERGYAGHSLWQWNELPQNVSPRYAEYARACASVGINGSVLNNVNATPQILTNEYLQKVKAIADVFRKYGISVYLSVNFSSSAQLGNLPTSDPLNADVQKWWKNKASEIYKLIPDFGGFLVKANSEGLPGPQDFGRTHADGANMLADALAPYKGIVMWRAFVYSPGDQDRAKQAYQEFVPLDGKFRSNVIIQIKNGPVDFQPREPFSPLFGALTQTQVMPELQITQEYLGFSNHLVYQAPLWKEFLDSDTYRPKAGATVAKLTDGTATGQKLTAFAGVANIGLDTNWCGHIFAQANWYAFGRLAWNPDLTSEEIADEWLRLTFTDDTAFVEPVKDMMLASRETLVNYMMPLGLHHIFAWGHHYGPEPWCDVPGARIDWLPRYYHKADSIGLGFNRSATGSNAVAQYAEPLSSTFGSIDKCPETLILWFHHVPWNHKMKDGSTMWSTLCHKYDDGVKGVREFQKTWDRMEQYVDRERFRAVQKKLKIQANDAVWWKDACLLYFQQFSNQPIPYDIERPVHELDDLKKIKLNMTHHN